MLRLFSSTARSSFVRSAFRPLIPVNIVPKATMATGQANDLSAGALFDVSHVTAVVTGGATGIGLMITQALQSNGAKVYITGRRQEVLDQTVKMYSNGPGQIIALRGDVSKKSEAVRLAGEIESREPKGVQLLVNNAGIARDDDTRYSNNGQPDMGDAKAISEHFLRSSEEQWLETMQTNVVGAYFMSMAFLPLLAKGGPSSQVVNVSSISGAMKGPSMGQPAYASSKAAATHLSRMLATIFKDVKVRVNVIAPGLFPSEMTAGKSGADNKSTLDGSKATNPSGRLGEERDMAATILFLAGRGGGFTMGRLCIRMEVSPFAIGCDNGFGSTLIQPAVAN
ncbi:NAD(P)-binding protein [Apiospora aurea]|uniref:NAD(P)-binding protein n=1 Tax=Apiospora aurea TaxID=335848 RepID=A0ABR1QFQ9_9PEZI